MARAVSGAQFDWPSSKLNDHRVRHRGAAAAKSSVQKLRHAKADERLRVDSALEHRLNVRGDVREKVEARLLFDGVDGHLPLTPPAALIRRKHLSQEGIDTSPVASAPHPAQRDSSDARNVESGPLPRCVFGLVMRIRRRQMSDDGFFDSGLGGGFRASRMRSSVSASLQFNSGSVRPQRGTPWWLSRQTRLRDLSGDTLYTRSTARSSRLRRMLFGEIAPPDGQLLDHLVERDPEVLRHPRVARRVPVRCRAGLEHRLPQNPNAHHVAPFSTED